MQDKRDLVFHEEGFQRPVKSQFWTMIKRQIYLEISWKLIQHDNGWLSFGQDGCLIADDNFKGVFLDESIQMRHEYPLNSIL